MAPFSSVLKFASVACAGPTQAKYPQNGSFERPSDSRIQAVENSKSGKKRKHKRKRRNEDRATAIVELPGAVDDALDVVPGSGVLVYKYLDTPDERGVPSGAAQDTPTSHSDVDGDDFIALDCGDWAEAISPATKPSAPTPASKRRANTTATYASPWLHPERVYSTIGEQFHHEIKDFMEYMSPTDEEVKHRVQGLLRVRTAVSRWSRRARTYAFGSSTTGLYLPGTDIDVVTLIDDGKTPSRKELFKLAQILRGLPWTENVQPIPWARVPIVKYFDKRSNCNVDISFNTTTGITTARTILEWQDREPALRPLALFLKEFLRVHGLNEVREGGLGGFAVICMVMAMIRNNEEVRRGRILAKDNLGNMLLEFFLLYGRDFNFTEYVVNTADDMRPFPKTENINMQPTKNTSPYVLAVQDPNDPNNNVTRGTHKFRDIRAVLADAGSTIRMLVKELESLPPEERSKYSILGPLLMHKGKNKRPSTPRAKELLPKDLQLVDAEAAWAFRVPDREAVAPSRPKRNRYLDSSDQMPQHRSSANLSSEELFGLEPDWPPPKRLSRSSREKPDLVLALDEDGKLGLRSRINAEARRRFWQSKGVREAENTNKQ